MVLPDGHQSICSCVTRSVFLFEIKDLKYCGSGHNKNLLRKSSNGKKVTRLILFSIYSIKKKLYIPHIKYKIYHIHIASTTNIYSKKLPQTLNKSRKRKLV